MPRNPNPTQTPTTTTGDADVDAALAATGYGWYLDPSYTLDTITGHIQHRHDDTINQQYVRRYSNQFKAGSVCPPICVTQDGQVIWGNHRIEGAKDAGWTDLPAIIVEVDGIGADAHVIDQLLTLATEENRKHGLAYSPKDRQERARTYLNLGFTNAAIQKKLGLTGAQVSGIKREVDADQRLVSLGLPLDIPRSTKRALAGPDARALNTEPFRELVTLTKSADLTSTEVNAIAKDAKAAGSDQGAMDAIRQVSKDMSQRIAEIGQGGTVRPTPVGKLRDALRRVTTLCSATTTPETYRDHTSGAAETITMLEEAINCLAGIRAVQVEEDEAE